MKWTSSLEHDQRRAVMFAARDIEQLMDTAPNPEELLLMKERIEWVHEFFAVAPEERERVHRKWLGEKSDGSALIAEPRSVQGQQR